MEIVKVEINLKVVNESIASFNCEQKVSGVTHTTKSGETTVILDGGYVLGSFDCPHCAIQAIGFLAAKIGDGERSGFGNYRLYKQDFMHEAIYAVS